MWKTEKHEWREIVLDDVHPSPRDCHSAVLYQNSMYIFGGGGKSYSHCCPSLLTHSDGYQWLNDIWALNCKTYKWSQVWAFGDIPSGRAGHSAVVWNDRMYVFAGWNGKCTMNDLYEFNFSTNVWTKIICNGQLPSKRDSHTANILGDRMFVVGGGDGKNRLNDVHEFNMSKSNTS